MNRGATLAASALLLAITNAAKADWEYTRWGMEEHEVFVAAKGQLTPCTAAPTACPKPNGPETARLYGDYRLGELDFKVVAYFDNASKKLSAVGLTLRRPELADKLTALFESRYGKPLSRRPQGQFDEWLWHTKTDQISLALVRTGPTRYAGVIYGPLPAKAPTPSRSPSSPTGPGSNQRD